MTTFLIAFAIMALAMAALGVSLLIKGEPMARSGCGGHRLPRNGRLGERASTSSPCSCQGGAKEISPEECPEK